MSDIDTKLMRAAIAVLEAGTFSKAAILLRIGQSGLTKQIAVLEKELGFAIFMRQGKRNIPTPPGEVFLAEARLSLEHHERAVRLSRSLKEQAEVVLHIGKSPYTDPYLLTTLLSLRLPLTPTLRVQLSSRLAADLTQEVLSGTLDLAFITGVPETARLTSVLVSDQPFFVAMLSDDHLASQKEVRNDDLHHRSCIVFERHVHPFLYDDLVRLTKPAFKPGYSLHHIMIAEDAAQFVRRGLGVAVLTQAGAWRIARSGLTIRPLIVDGLRVRTRLTCRSDDQNRTVRDFVRTFMMQIEQKAPARQMALRMAA
jgi:DNA-binding transcriptional LysR family regulator